MSFPANADSDFSGVQLITILSNSIMPFLQWTSLHLFPKYVGELLSYSCHQAWLILMATYDNPKGTNISLVSTLL